MGAVGAVACGDNWTAVLVGLMSGCAAVIGPFWLWKKQGQRERDSVRAALFAEVEALIEIVESRCFLATLREYERELAGRQTSAYAPSQGNQDDKYFKVKIDDQYSRIYQGNVSRLGVLTADEAKQIVRFHQLADSVRLDVIEGGGLADGTSDPEAFKETADLLEAAMKIGRELTARQSGSTPKCWQFWKTKK